MAKPIPFEFLIDELTELNPYTKPMFGAHGVYVDNKIVFIVRERESSPQDNGVWLATSSEHHNSLQKIFPSMRSITVFGPGPTGWQVLPSASHDFEESVLKACDMVKANDIRIGKIPKTKIRKKTNQKSNKKTIKKIQKK